MDLQNKFVSFHLPTLLSALPINNNLHRIGKIIFTKAPLKMWFLFPRTECAQIPIADMAYSKNGLSFVTFFEYHRHYDHLLRLFWPLLSVPNVPNSYLKMVFDVHVEDRRSNLLFPTLRILTGMAERNWFVASIKFKVKVQLGKTRWKVNASEHTH